MWARVCIKVSINEKYTNPAGGPAGVVVHVVHGSLTPGSAFNNATGDVAGGVGYHYKVRQW